MYKESSSSNLGGTQVELFYTQLDKKPSSWSTMYKGNKFELQIAWSPIPMRSMRLLKKKKKERKKGNIKKVN